MSLKRPIALLNNSKPLTSSLSLLFVLAAGVAGIFFCLTLIFGSLIILAGGVAYSIQNSTPNSSPQVLAAVASPTSTMVLPVSEPTPTPSASLSPLSLTPEFTPTIEPTATESLPPTVTPTSTMDITRQAQVMLGLVQQLFDGNIVSSTNGNYYAIQDYEATWNQANSYQKTYLGYDFANFVLRADAVWQPDKNAENWSESGCGFIFHEDEAENHYLVEFTNNRAYLYRRMNGGLGRIGVSYRYEISKDLEQANIMIVVEDNWITLFVDDEQVYHFQHPNLESGKMAFTVISAASGGTGTNCSISNIELWEIVK